MAVNAADLTRTQLGQRGGILRNAAEDGRAARRWWYEADPPRWARGPAAIAYVHRYGSILVVLSACGGLIAVAIDQGKAAPSYKLAQGFHRGRVRAYLDRKREHRP